MLWSKDAPRRHVSVRFSPEASTLADVATALKRGEVVVIRADGQLSVTSGLAGLHPTASALLAEGFDFSYLPAIADPTGVLTLGAPIPRTVATVEGLRLALLDLGAEAFAARPALGLHLGFAAIRGLKKKWLRPVIVDGFLGDRVLKGGMLLAAAWELSVWLRKNVPQKRLGLVLPPGLGASVANLACVLADKTPVNLNFTAGRALNEIALKRGGVETVFSAAVMQEKVKDFPWAAVPRLIDLKDLLTSLPKWRIVLRWLAGFVLPAPLLRAAIGTPEEGGDREAVLLFTSGSSGDPKGVVLTHRNILGNVAQFEAVLSNSGIESLLACLPIFHSFGCTVTFWWPITGGPVGVTYVSPTETAKLAELIARHKVGLLLSTPTFLRTFLRKATAEQMKSLKIIVTGAEKLPSDLSVEVEKRFGIPVCQGYGMTEASPAVAVNLPDFRLPAGHERIDGPRRLGSVGRLIPGLSLRIRDPETEADLPVGQTGMLWLQGVNLFPGYLDDPVRSGAVLKDRWYKTDDLGRLDDEGFLHIEGRLSRFSKLAGEMVPHGTLEETIARAFPELGDDFRPVIMGVDDPGKGEALVLLSTHPLDQTELRRRLSGAGVPNLWIPRRVRVVAEIPHFATGKIDLKECRRLANQTESE